MDLLGTRRVDPIHQSPQTRAYGFFTEGTVPTSLIFTHLVSFSFPTIFAGCLPRPTLGRRSLGHATFVAFQVLFSPPTSDRASLAVSLALIGSLTPVPPADSASPPEVTPCSSLPCRPHTLVRWVNENAFASIVQARPCPTFGRPVHLRGSPHRLQPATSPHALQIPPCDGHPALRSIASPADDALLPSWIWRPSFERQRDFNPPEQRAAQRTLR